LTPVNLLEQAKVNAFVDALEDIYKPIIPTFSMPGERILRVHSSTQLLRSLAL
jgi:hypothetical protein